MRTSSSSFCLALVAAGLSLAPTAGAAVAQEVPPTPAGQAPITVDDSLSLYGTRQLGVYDVDRAYVLLNDRDPDGDALTICGFTASDDQAIAVRSGVSPKTYPPAAYLSVTPLVNRTATYTVSYLACDGQSQTPGTLTVDVTRVEPIVVKVLSRGNRLRFTNPGDVAVTVTYGKPSASSYDGVDPACAKRFQLAARSSRTVRVARATVAYFAYTTDAAALAGSGTVKGTRPRSCRPVPAGC